MLANRSVSNVINEITILDTLGTKMKTNGMKKAALYVITIQDSRWEDNIVCIASLPTSFYHKSESRCNMIFELLPQGKENAVSLKVLSAATGLPERELRTRIVEELEDGLPCLSSCRPHGGYFRPSDGEKGMKEIQRFYYQERSRARSTLRKLKAVRRMMAQCQGQTTLEALPDPEKVQQNT